MARTLSIFLFFVISLISCEKSGFDIPQDNNYPTLINKLSPDVLSVLKASYIQNNQYINSSLNQFGFCALEEDDLWRTVESPPLLDLMTQSEAIDIVNDFVSKNQKYIGIKNPSSLTFYSVFSSSPYWDGSTFWCAKSDNQRIDSLEVLNSGIIFHVRSKEVVYCAGNWFPDIYIPNKFNLSKEKAKAILLNKVVSHYTIVGQKYDVNISSSSLAESTVKLTVYPIKADDKIELRVTWEINIPGPVYYIIFVDVMTGEIISEEPTIIS